jgi:hypothetical protein
MCRRGKRLLQFVLHCKDGAPPFLRLLISLKPISHPIPTHSLFWGGINVSDSCVVPLYHEYDNRGESHNVTGLNAIATSIVAPTRSKRQRKRTRRREVENCRVIINQKDKDIWIHILWKAVR